MKKLQTIQNSAARLVCKISKRDRQHIMIPVLKDLHWLLVEIRIIFKILCIVFKCLYFETAPIYLKDLLKTKSRSGRLRSDAAVKFIRPPPTKTKTYGDRAFMSPAPAPWNSLPANLRKIN